MNGHSLCNPRQRREQIAGGLQLARLCNPILRRTVLFLFHNPALDCFGRGMRWIQSERLIGKRLGSQPVGFKNGLRVLHEGIGQNGAGERIALIQFVGFAQQLDGFGRFLLSEKLLAFRDQTVSFGFALDAILSALFQVGQLGIIGEFGSFASQQIQGARVLARMQTAVDLLNELRFGFGASLLVGSFLQALSTSNG